MKIEQIDKKRDWKFYTIKSLAFWVFFGIILGIGLGVVEPKLAIEAKFGIDWFIKGLKWLVAPIIFLTIITGILGLKNLKEVGKIGSKALIYFEIVSTLTLGLGILFGNFFNVGKGMNLDASKLDPKSVEKFSSGSQDITSLWSILKGAIPSDPISPFINGNTLQVLTMSLFIALMLSLFGGKYRPTILKYFEKAQGYFFTLLTWLMWFSPIASFSAMAFLIGKFGIASLINMGGLLGVMLIATLTFVFGLLGLIMAFFKLNIFKFISFISKDILTVFATSSSESALVPLMRRLENAGVSKGVTGLVLPTGYSFNLDATNIYLSLSIIFISQAFNIPLSLGEQLSILLILMITSKGAVGVTGSGFIVLVGTLAAMGGSIPVVCVSILLGVDKFMSEMRAIGNLCGNAVATVVVGAWSNQIDMEKFKEALENPNDEKYNQMTINDK